MALTLPDADDLAIFWGDEGWDLDSDRSELLIQLAADIFWIATNLDDDPDDARMQRLIKYAICDMAIYLYVSRDDIDANYAPFVTERVGSYAYSKAYTKTVSAVAAGKSTDVPFFDIVVNQIQTGLIYDSGTPVGGEYVFQKGYRPLWQEAFVEDPSIELSTRRGVYDYFGYDY